MNQKTILCYGDSNTWGYVPTANRESGIERYGRDQRWPGLLQQLLSDLFYVVEEGLNGRTTNLDYHIPPDRNGKTYLASCLYSHAPIDLVVLALGANDLKIYFNRSASQICDGLAELIDIIQACSYGEQMKNPPKILLLSPPIPLPIAETFYDDIKNVPILQGAIKKAETLVPLCEALAAEKGCNYLNISDISPSIIDGVHYDHHAHRVIATRVQQYISLLHI